MKKFVFYSTLFMVFSDRVYVTVATVNLFAAYAIVVVNLCVLAYLGRAWVPRGLLIFISCLVLSGVTGLAFATVSFVSFAKDFVGIVPNVIYACAFLRFLRFDTELFFERYAQYAFYAAVLGLVIFPLQLSALGRLTSVMREPSSFCVVCIPALFYYVDQWQRHGLYRARSIVLLLACALTFSSVGFMGMLMAVYLFISRFRFSLVVAPVLVIMVGLGIYTASDFFRLRVDDTARGVATLDLDGANLSSYGVLVSFFVTEKILQEHPIVGGGLGSYVIAHDKYAPQMPGNDVFVAMGMGELARWDASSLLLRVLAEFGLLGFASCTFYLLRYFPWQSTPERKAIAFAILCYVFMKCVRSGTYFDPEEWLFFVTYGVNGILARSERKLASRVLETGQPQDTSGLFPSHESQPAY